MRPGAQSSVSRRTVGLLTIESSTPYQASIIAALAGVCEERDVNMVVFTDAYLGGHAGENACRLFAAKLAGPDNVDAMIVTVLGNEAPPERVAAFLERFRSIPVCTVSLTVPGFPYVQIDNQAGVRALVRHLVGVHHYKRFVFLGRPPEHVEGQLRRQAYAEALASYGIEPLPDIIVPGDQALDPDIIRPALDRVGEVDAIVAVDDYLVPGLMAVLDSRGIRVPQDVAVTGFDDSDIARGNDPPLTSVRQPFYAMLDAALTSVLEPLDGHEVGAETLVVPVIVLRRSCGCLSEGMSLYPGVTDTQSSMTSLLARAREDVVAEWERVPGLRLPSGSWETGLYAAFVSELLSGKRESAELLTTYLTEHCGKGGEVQAWNPVPAILKRHVWPLVAAEPLVLARAEAAIHRLGSQLGVAEAGRAQGQRLRAEVLARQHAVVADRLLRNLDREKLIAAMPESFHRLGIPTYWFSTFANETASDVAVLSSAMVRGQPLNLTPEGEPFSAARLVPESQRPTDERYAWVVSPVHDEERPLGLLVCGYVRDHGVTYDIMALQLGAALHGALLVQRIAEETARRERAERERLVRELELAQRIQTSILPRNPTAVGLEIATVMVPATEVGGDYFDVIPLPEGCFIGIGDVAGHGLNAGLVMLMLQSAVASAVSLAPDLSPTQAFLAVNRALYENIRIRLLQDEHVTLALLRYRSDGLVTFAGAHEDMLVFRARTGEVETVELTGVWAGIRPDLSALISDQQLQLELGDVLVLYTDGTTEAMNAAREAFGFERLVAEVSRVGRQSVTAIRDHLLAAVQSWLQVQQDDIAFVVVRYVGTG